MLRGEARDAAERHRPDAADGVADGEEARVGEADDVARIRLLDRLPALREQLVRPRQADLLAQARVEDLHVALEPAGADAQERDAIAVQRVHVRLDLEDEAGELLGIRTDDAVVHGLYGAGRRSQLHEPVQEQLDAEVRDGAAEEGRRHLAPIEPLRVERLPGQIQQLDLLPQPGELGHREDRFEGRVLGANNRHGSGALAALGTVEQVELALAAVEDAAEIRAIADRPVHRGGADAQDLFDLAQELQRLARRAVHLVDEGEDRDAALAADVEQLPRLRLDAVGRVDDHHRAVGSGQRPVGVFAEVLVAGGVQQVDLPPLVRELEHRGGSRDAALLLHRHPVRGGVALVLARAHRARKLDRPAV